MFVTFSCQDGISGWLCEEMSGEGLSLDQMDVSGIDSILLGKQSEDKRKRTRRKKQNLLLDQIDNGFNCRQHTSPPRGPSWQDHCCGNVASPGGNCGHEGELQVDHDGGDNDNHGEDNDGSGEDGDDDDGGAIEIVKS